VTRRPRKAIPRKVMPRSPVARKAVPRSAMAVCGAALSAPLWGALLLPPGGLPAALALGLLALVPVFLLAYYRGWPGVALALAAGVAVLALSAALALVRHGGLPAPASIAGVALAFVAVAAATGWLSEVLHRGRERAQALALTDELTGLPNRRHLRLVLERDFAAAQRHHRPLTVVMFDLDQFKAYNDRYGHAAGDAALQAFADMLQDRTRRTDLSARYGGEEFLTILAETEIEDALTFVDVLRERIAGLELPEGSITASIGLACYTPGMTTLDDLIAAADDAMYRAKAAGGDTVHVAELHPAEEVARG
jgi:diguanylate cyclase (GGDEF)-like protein